MTQNRLERVSLEVLDDLWNVVASERLDAVDEQIVDFGGVIGSKVRLIQDQHEHLNIAEIDIFGNVIA